MSSSPPEHPRPAVPRSPLAGEGVRSFLPSPLAGEGLPVGPTDPLAGLTVLERGWLSSNNVLIHAAPSEDGAVLVDTGHVNHAAQTCALVAHALQGRPLARIVNTHLHSDHCGGNAALQAAHGAPIWVAPGMAAPVQAWDANRLTYEGTGQRIARYGAQGELAAGDALVAGGRRWEVLRAPGHDPDSVMLFDRAHGVLISADALWENGFGVVFPEVVGEPGFDDVQAVLALIAELPVRVVIPGHGRAFTDVAGALARARSRLAGFRADPARHARHAAKVLVKYHLMEERAQDEAALLDWAESTPYLRGLWERHGRGGGATARDWPAGIVDELVAGGALRREGAMVADAG
jgi:glyoxylase-like metal-dependent hydrolase (beta-lactamase superfamily II)